MDTIFWDKFRSAIKNKKEQPNKLSSRQAALQIGTSPSALSRIENGMKPDADTFIKMCNWLNNNTKNEFQSNNFSIDSLHQSDNKINLDDERLIYETIEKINAATNASIFSGVITQDDKIFYYLKFEGLSIKVLTEICKRLHEFGKWESFIISLNNKFFPNNSNGICLHKENFNPQNITFSITKN